MTAIIEFLVGIIMMFMALIQGADERVAYPVTQNVVVSEPRVMLVTGITVRDDRTYLRFHDGTEAVVSDQALEGLSLVKIGKSVVVTFVQTDGPLEISSIKAVVITPPTLECGNVKPSCRE